jgi:valyl-tRNA synthetase
MEKYELNLVGAELYSFIWEDFCSSYIEFAKFNLDNNTTKSVLYTVLSGIIKMMHPFMPFVTEEIYQMLPIKDAESIMVSEYPKYDKKLVFADDKKEMDLIIEYIALFRNRKAENNIGSDFEVITDIDNELILRMLKLTDKVVEKSELSGTVEVVLDKYKVTICYDDSASKGEEKALLEKEKESLENSIARREKLLANENYVAKAPEKIVNQERESLAAEKEKLKVVSERLEQLK